MFALIYDEHDLAKPRKYVLSLHDTRETAEIALENRKKALNRKIHDCYTRIVWTEAKIKEGEYISPDQFVNWRPGEVVPHGEMYSDED